MEFYEYKRREWQRFNESEKIIYLLKQKLQGLQLILKHSSPPVVFNPIDYREDGVEFSVDYVPHDKEIVTLSVTMKRHIEIDFIFVKNLPNGNILFQPVEGRISADMRASHRIPVRDSVVHAANFRVPKDTVLSGFGIKNSLTNQVIFEDFQNQNTENISGLKIYNSFSKDLPEEILILKDTHKGIYVRNINSIDKPDGENSDLFDVQNLADKNEKFGARIKQLKENGFISFAIVPIVSKTDEKGMVCVGYISSQSAEIIPEEMFDSMNELANNILMRMAEANSVPFKVNQKIVNISRGGVVLELDNKDLKNTLMDKKKMIFDLVFSKQAPLRFQGDICYMNELDSSAIAGVAFRGIGHTGTGKGNMRRLEKYIESIERAR